MTPKNRIYMALFAILALVVASLACGGNVSPTKVGEVSSPETTSTEQSTEPSAEQTTEVEPPSPTDTPEGPITYQVGDIISIGDLVMVVLGWDTPLGDDFSKPDEGKKFVAVDVLVVNQGNESTSISSFLQMLLKDDTGQRYDVDLMAAMAAGGSSPDGEISPGERVRGKVGFQVPKEVTSLVFVFDADIFGTGKVFVELGPEPIALEPPSELVGEQEQTTFAIGDIIEIGDLTLTVNEVTFPTGDSFIKPDEGNNFVIVDLTFENKGTEAAAISSFLQMYLKDATGQKYDLDIMATAASGGTTPDGEISPTEKIRGQVGYQVPEDIQGLVFVFDADIFGYGKVFVVLPMGVEPTQSSDLILDVPEVLGKTAVELERILGPAMLITPNDDNDDELAGGEYRDYTLGMYDFFLSFDKNGFARGFQVLDGLSKDNYSLEQWAILLPHFGLTVTVSPDKKASAAYYWYNFNGYKITIAAQNTSGKPVRTVQIEDANFFGP